MNSCLFLRIWARILVKIYVKTLSRKYSQKRYEHAKQSASHAFKIASKNHKIFGLINKYLKENIYPRKKTASCWWSKINVIK